MQGCNHEDQSQFLLKQAVVKIDYTLDIAFWPGISKYSWFFSALKFLKLGYECFLQKFLQFIIPWSL